MFSLNKSERLCGKSSTTELFLNGRSINDDSFRVIFIDQDYSREVYFKSQFIVPRLNFICLTLKIRSKVCNYLFR